MRTKKATKKTTKKTTKKKAQKRTPRLRAKSKHFFVVSALVSDSSALGNLKRFDTESEATDHAAEIINLRAQTGRHQLDFYVLKVVARVGVKAPPVAVEKL